MRSVAVCFLRGFHLILEDFLIHTFVTENATSVVNQMFIEHGNNYVCAGATLNIQVPPMSSVIQGWTATLTQSLRKLNAHWEHVFFEQFCAALIAQFKLYQIHLKV